MSSADESSDRQKRPTGEAGRASTRTSRGDQGQWSEAYEGVLSGVLEGWGRAREQDRNLLPMIYALRYNDAQLARALLAFAREQALRLDDADAACALLEVAEAALGGRVGKDVCQRIADNLMEEAFERLLRDRRFDRYYGARCACSAARLATRVRELASLEDAADVIRAAASLARLSADGAAAGSASAEDAARRVYEGAHARIREAVGLTRARRRTRPEV